MSLLQNWRDIAYNQEADKKQLQQFWTNYFLIEKNIYEQLLSNPDEVVKGTVKELAEKYKVDVMTMVGFLDGINDSLVIPNPIEEMEEDTVVTLAYDKELLYKNMVDAKADWLYELPMWDEIFTPERSWPNCSGCWAKIIRSRSVETLVSERPLSIYKGIAAPENP